MYKAVFFHSETKYKNRTYSNMLYEIQKQTALKRFLFYQLRRVVIHNNLFSWPVKWPPGEIIRGYDTNPLKDIGNILLLLSERSPTI